MPQLAGEDILASDIKIAQTRNKAVSESVTSSTTLQNDDDFVIAMEAGKTYYVQLWLHVVGHATAGDIKVAWATSGTITSNGRSCFGPAESTTDVRDGNFRATGHGLTTSVTYGCDATTTGVVKEEVSVTCTVAGNLTLQWAQGTSSATATTCSTASRIIVQEMETF